MGELFGICCLAGDLGPVESELRQPRGSPAAQPTAAMSQRGNASIAQDHQSEGRMCHVDGRFDNAEILADGLGLRPADWKNNADLVLELFRRRGQAGLVEIVGDWSLALWDPHNRYLILASDYAGNRPLHYHRDKDHVCWGTSLAALALRVRAAELDRDFVIETLAQGAAKERTPYAGIRSVPAGSVLRISFLGVQVVGEWQAPVDRETRLSDEASYADHLFALLQEAVAVRLRGQSKICAELSGGLDSSSIVCMVKHLQSKGDIPETNVVTISYQAEGSSDESFRRTVEGTCNFPHHHVHLDDHGFIGAAHCGDARPAWWEPRHVHVAQVMERLNSSVLLTGQMGDLIMGNWFDGTGQVSHHIREGALGTALGTALQWSLVQGTSLYPLLWRALTSLRVPGMPSANEQTSEADTSLTKSALQRAREIRATRDEAAKWRGARPGRIQRLRAFVETLENRALQCPEPLQGVSYSHPFTHRPLAEFMLEIPPDIVYGPGEPRRLMRRALSSILPEEIVRRRSKAGYNSVFRKTLVPLAHGLAKDPRPLALEDQGFLVGQNFRERLRRLEQGLECGEPQLRHLILMELWLRSFTTKQKLTRAA